MTTIKRIKKIIEYLTIFFIILGCNSVYYVREGNHITEIIIVLSIILGIFEIHYCLLNIKTLKNFILWLLLYFVLLGLLLMVNVDSDSFLSFCGRYLVFVPILTLVFVTLQKSGNINRLFCVYCNIMTIIATVSLLFWFFGTLLHNIHPTGYVIGYWGGKFKYPSYYNLYFERQFDSAIGIYRNQAIFAEAPMFSLNLVFAIAMEIFLKEPILTNKKKVLFRVGNKRLLNGKMNAKMLILILALVSTLTTTGYIMLVVMLYAWYLIHAPKTVVTRNIKYISAFFIGIGAVIGIVYIFRGKADSYSWELRVNNFRYGFDIWKSSLIFGMGYSNRVQYAYSNSLFEVLSFGGIVLGIIYFYPLIGGIIKSFIRREKNLLIFQGIVLIEFIFTMCGRTFLMLFLISYIYANMTVGYPMSVSSNALGGRTTKKESNHSNEIVIG